MQTSSEVKQCYSFSTQTETFAALSALKGIHVIEADMNDVIKELRGNPYIAFAHTISGDFHCPRRMTAGVAVTFTAQFNKPEIKDCVTESLAFQKSAVDGAGVYSLITKPHYFGKPTMEEYDLAFDNFTADFNKKRFSTLICSPMGCVRDLVKLEHFAAKINQFHDITGATIVIGTMARRTLRHGLPHHEFVKQLRSNIKNCQQATNWYLLPDEDMKLYLEKTDVPANTLVLEPAVGKDNTYP